MVDAGLISWTSLCVSMRLCVDQGLRGRLVSPLWLGRMLEPKPRPFWSRCITCSLIGYAYLRASVLILLWERLVSGIE